MKAHLYICNVCVHTKKKRYDSVDSWLSATFDNNLHFDTSVGDGYASWSVEIKKAKSSGSNRGSVSNIDTECRRYVMVIRKEEKCERGRKKNKKLF